VLVAHACDPSYSGGSDQEDHLSKPDWANSSQDPISKNPSQKRAGGVAQGVGPEFKPQYFKRKKKQQKTIGYKNRNNLCFVYHHISSPWQRLHTLKQFKIYLLNK
jgi:hypothetical protein